MVNLLEKNEQTGRSMVEMLGVLAIIGVLSVGGIAGYSKAMTKFKITTPMDQVSMMVVQIVMNNVLIRYGAKSSYGSDIPLARAGIITKINMIFFAINIGISQGLQPIISYNYGARKLDRVREAYLKAAISATIISTVSFICFQLFPRQIIGIFGSESEAYFRFAEKFFRIFLFCTFINGLQPITANFFKAIGKANSGIFLS